MATGSPIEMMPDLNGGSAQAPRTGRRLPPALLAVAIAAVFFAAVAPTLSWLEFSNGSENLVAETVLEMRRGGEWLVPTLELQPRTQKPPLPAWLTAAGVRPATVAALWEADPARREAAYRRLAWEVRRSAMLASCLTVLAVFGLGRAIGGPGLGVSSALVCATSVMFLRFGRYATTNVHLTLWATAANVMLARAVLAGRWWSGCVLGGLALGLAFMSKGPVVFMQTALPVVAFAAWRTWSRRRGGMPPEVAVLGGSAPAFDVRSSNVRR